jgi:choline kinase
MSAAATPLVILAAGAASRMERSLATAGDGVAARAGGRQKGMIGVGPHARPLLDYQLALARRAGIVDIVLVVGALADAIIQRYDGAESEVARHGLRVHFATQQIPAGRSRPLGTADAVLCAMNVHPALLGTSFLVCNSDNLYSAEALAALAAADAPGGCIAYDRAALCFDEQRIAQFAVLCVDADGWVRDIIEKPGDLAEAPVDASSAVRVSMNLWKLPAPLVRPALEACPLHPQRGEKELPIALRRMIAHHPHCLHAVPWSEHVPDLTSADDLPVVDELLRGQFPLSLWSAT